MVWHKKWLEILYSHAIVLKDEKGNILETVWKSCSCHTMSEAWRKQCLKLTVPFIMFSPAITLQKHLHTIQLSPKRLFHSNILIHLLKAILGMVINISIRYLLPIDPVFIAPNWPLDNVENSVFPIWFIEALSILLISSRWLFLRCQIV